MIWDMRIVESKFWDHVIFNQFIHADVLLLHGNQILNYVYKEHFEIKVFLIFEAIFWRSCSKV